MTDVDDLIEELDSPWQSERVLRDLCVERDLTLAEAADKLECSPSTVSRYTSKHDIPTGGRGPVNVNISGFTEAEAATIDQRVDQSSASSRSEWLRRRLRAGMMVFDAGEVDPKALDELLGVADE